MSAKAARDDQLADAVKAAAEAIHRHGCPGDSCPTVIGGWHLERARAALEAAAPFLVARAAAAATTLVRPGNGPAQWDEVVVVPLDRLRELLEVDHVG